MKKAGIFLAVVALVFLISLSLNAGFVSGRVDNTHCSSIGLTQIGYFESVDVVCPGFTNDDSVYDCQGDNTVACAWGSSDTTPWGEGKVIWNEVCAVSGNPLGCTSYTCACNFAGCNQKNNGLRCDGCNWISVSSVPETCENTDNNCNGEIDEGCPFGYLESASCASGLFGWARDSRNTDGTRIINDNPDSSGTLNVYFYYSPGNVFSWSNAIYLAGATANIASQNVGSHIFYKSIIIPNAAEGQQYTFRSFGVNRGIESVWNMPLDNDRTLTISRETCGDMNDNNCNGLADEGCFYPLIFINSPISNRVYNTPAITLDVTTNEATNMMNPCTYSLDGGISTSMNAIDSMHYSFAFPSLFIGEGSHTFVISCRDTDNMQNSTSVSFSVDTIAPSLNIISPSSLLYDTRNILVSITSDGTQQKIWFNWNGTEDIYLSPRTVRFASGFNTLTAYVNDSNGNINSRAFTFFVDDISPVVNIVNPASNGLFFGTNNIPIEYTIVESNPTNCWWTNNSGLTNHTINCGDNITGQTWISNVNTVTVYAQDILGHIGSSTRTFNVDINPPSADIITPTAGGIFSGEILIRVLIVDSNLDFNSLRYEARENNANGVVLASGILRGDSSQPSTYNASFIADSSWNNRNITLIVYASDIYGRNSSDSVDFVVDNTIPSITFITPAGDNSSIFNRDFNLNVLVQGYRLNMTDYRIYPLGLPIVQDNIIQFNTPQNSYVWADFVNISSLTDGVYGLGVGVRDSANPAHSISANTWFTIDRSAPSININFPTDGGIYNYSCINVNITFDSGVAWFIWNSTRYDLPQTICTNFNEGNNTIEIYVNDTAGNIVNRNVNFFVDTIQPNVWFVDTTEADNSLINRSNIMVNVSALDSGSGINYLEIELFNSGGLVNSNSGNLINNLFADFIGLADGTYWFNANAVDNAVNSYSSETRTVTIDTSPPIISVISPINTTYTSAEINFEVSGNEDLSSCEYSLDGGINVMMNMINSTSFNASSGVLPETGHSLVFSCTDPAGNIGTTAGNIISFGVDITPPVISISSPADGSVYPNGSIEVNITTDFTAQAVWYDWNGNSYSYPGASPIFITGTNVITAYANDSAGNINQAASTFDINPLFTIIDSTIYGTYYPWNTNSDVNTTSVSDSLVNMSTIAGINVVEITESYLYNSTLIEVLLIHNCTAINTYMYGGYCQDSIIINSRIINSTINLSYIYNSTIINSNIFNSTIINSYIENSTVINSYIENSTIIDAFVNNSNITNNIICNGTVTFNGNTYDADLNGCQNLTNLINYPPVARLSAPAQADVSASVLADGSQSSDLNIPGLLNDTLLYYFDFGDGSNYSESLASSLDGVYDGKTTHAYGSPGVKSITFVVTDSFGKFDSDFASISIVTPGPGPGSGSGGGGGGGGLAPSYQAGPGNKIYWPTSEQLAKCYTVSLRLREVIKFFVEYKLYYFETINLSSQKVDVEVRWPVKTSVFSAGDFKRFDVNGDGHEDISVRLNSIDRSGNDLFANVVMCRLFKEGQTAETDTPEGTVIGGQTTGQKFMQSLKDNWILVLAILFALIALIFAIAYFIRMKRRKDRINALNNLKSLDNKNTKRARR